jgi:hypothetical protein
VVIPLAVPERSICGKAVDWAVGCEVLVIAGFHSAMSKLMLEVVGSVKSIVLLVHVPQNMRLCNHLQKLLLQHKRHLVGSDNYCIVDVGMPYPYRLLEVFEARP